MPLYEYQCPRCQRCQEHYLGVNDQQPESLACEACRFEGRMQRVISAPAPPKFAGVDGQIREREKLRRRNADYRQTSKYKDERVAGLESARRRGLPC